MKKKYMKPYMEVVYANSASLLVGSSDKVTGSKSGEAILNYGGVDEDGELDPD